MEIIYIKAEILNQAVMLNRYTLNIQYILLLLLATWSLQYSCMSYIAFSVSIFDGGCQRVDVPHCIGYHIDLTCRRSWIRDPVETQLQGVSIL